MKLFVTCILILLVRVGFAQDSLATSDANKALSLRFEHCKRKLPMPVKGEMPQKKKAHPDYRVYNPISGIDISTTANAQVSAVFDGKVAGVLSVTNDDSIVILQHGYYFSVYTGLKKVSVIKGQQVVASQLLGVVADKGGGESTLNFQLWKSIEKGGRLQLNAEDWLQKKK